MIDILQDAWEGAMQDIPIGGMDWIELRAEMRTYWERLEKEIQEVGRG